MKESPPVYLRLTQQYTVREKVIVPAPAPEPAAEAPARGKKKAGKKKPVKKPARQPVEQWVDTVRQVNAYAIAAGDVDTRAVLSIETDLGYNAGASAKATVVTMFGGGDLRVAESPDQVWEMLQRATGATLVTSAVPVPPPALTADGVAFSPDEDAELESVFVLEPAHAPTRVLAAEVLEIRTVAGVHHAILSVNSVMGRDGTATEEEPPTMPAPWSRPCHECFENVERAFAQLDETMERRGADAPSPARAGEAALGEGSSEPVFLACGLNARESINDVVYFAEGDGERVGSGVLVEIGEHEGAPILRIALGARDEKGEFRSFIARRATGVWSTQTAAEDALAPRRALGPVKLADGPEAKLAMTVYAIEGDAACEGVILGLAPKRTAAIHFQASSGAWVKDFAPGAVFSDLDAALAFLRATPSPAAAGEAALGEGASSEGPSLPGADGDDEEDDTDGTESALGECAASAERSPSDGAAVEDRPSADAAYARDRAPEDALAVS